jgi:hypothetical protein
LGTDLIQHCKNGVIEKFSKRRNNNQGICGNLHLLLLTGSNNFPKNVSHLISVVRDIIKKMNNDS